MAAPKTILIANAKRIHRGTLVGRFDVELPSGMTIWDMLLLESGSRIWVNFPAGKYERPDGVISWKPWVVFKNCKDHQRFQNAVMPLAIRALMPERKAGLPF
jgi:hypothetical protein